MMKRTLGANNFFAIFGTFGRYVTNLRGTFVGIFKGIVSPDWKGLHKFSLDRFEV
jgi:hypothetical protein